MSTIESRRATLRTTLQAVERDLNDALDREDDEAIVSLVDAKSDALQRLAALDSIEARKRDNANVKAQEAERVRIEKARKTAKQAAAKIKKSAQGVDRAFEALQGCNTALFQAIDGYYEALRVAGISDHSRLRNQLSNRMKSALWFSAPEIANLLRVERVGAARQVTLSESIDALIVSDVK